MYDDQKNEPQYLVSREMDSGGWRPMICLICDFEDQEEGTTNLTNLTNLKNDRCWNRELWFV